MDFNARRLKKIYEKIQGGVAEAAGMMIDSVYTHREIFLRELISNAADAIDKQYYKSLSGGESGMNRGDYSIRITADKEKRTLTVSDNGCGMNDSEMEENLGTIAHSGTGIFRSENAGSEAAGEVIGQFGVGFYSAFMVAKKVEVISRPYGSEKAYKWSSEGVSGYTVEETDKESNGTDVILYLKDNEEEENYDEFLDTYELKALVRKYSDYIRYPIIMNVEIFEPDPEKKGESFKKFEDQTVNSMVPLWKKKKSELTEEETDNFYRDKFHDYDKPLLTIPVNVEGAVSFSGLLFVPSRAPYDFYSKEYERGLELYGNGVLITEKCAELIPEYFAFVRGVVDSSDLSLNLSREMLQHNRQLKAIASAVEKKIRNALLELMKEDTEKYEKFFGVFGTQLKYGIYTSFGADKDKIEDLLIYRLADNGDYTSLADYVENMKDGQEAVYYACGQSVEGIRAMPQMEFIAEKGYEVLAMTENVDEFVVKLLDKYKDKPFKSISGESGEEKKEELSKIQEDAIAFVGKTLGDKVSEVRASSRLKNHPVCFVEAGELSIEMEKILNSMPNAQTVNAKKVLEINLNHPVFAKITELFESDKEALEKLSFVLYDQARLIAGLELDNPAEFSQNVCDLIAKR